MPEIKEGAGESRALKVIDSFRFYLREPVSYADSGRKGSGRMEKIDMVTIHGPGLELLFESYTLIQMIGRAMMSSVDAIRNLASYIDENQGDYALLTDGREDEKADLLDQSPAQAGDQAKLYINFSDMSVVEAINEFRRIAMMGCVRVNGKNVTAFQWKELRNDDILDMFKQFIGVFILPSVFSDSAESTEKTIEEG